MSSRKAGGVPGSAGNSEARGDLPEDPTVDPPVDRLVDRAAAAMTEGDLAEARSESAFAPAGAAGSTDAAALLVAGPAHGELRQATLLFADLVGSTALSERHEPELYGGVMRRYTTACRRVIEQRYEGHVTHVAGDGLLAVFGIPVAHENDVERAVRAALDIAAELEHLSEEIERAVGERLAARAAVHRGLVYLDRDEDEVYGLAANVAARLHELADPGEVLVSAEVHDIVGGRFATEALPARTVKGVSQPLRPYRVIGVASGGTHRRPGDCGPLVGRESEMAVLGAAWAEVCRGDGERPRGVHVTGEAGIGKSRLAATFLGEIAAGIGARVDLAGSPFHTDASFHPVRALIETRVGMLPATPPPGATQAGLDDLVTGLRLGPDASALLADIAGLPPDAGSSAPVEGPKRRAAAVDAAARFIGASLAPGPAVLVVEDLHWCDPSTVDIVAHVLADGPGDLLVLTVSRDAPPTGIEPADVVALGPLGADAASALAQAVAPGLTDDACRGIVARADGVPLFVEELAEGAARAVASSVVAGQAGGLRDEPHAASSPGSVPLALYDLLVSRLSVSPSAVPVAGAAATVGREVDRALLSRVSGEAQAAVDDALGRLADARVLVPGAVDGSYLFRHELLREVAYDVQPLSRRRRFHGRTADVLAEPGAGGVVDWRLVASHREQAGQGAEAVAAYRLAADAAQRLGELAEARGLLERAIGLVGDLPDSPERGRSEVALRLRRGFLAVSAEGNNSLDAVHDYERCLEIALADPAGDEMFSTLIALWGYYVIRGELERADQVSRMLQAGVGTRPEYGPDNESSFGVVRWYSGDFAAARERLEDGVAGLVAGGGGHYTNTWFIPTDAWASAHIFLALARFVRGDVEGADEQVAAALARCRNLGFPHGPYTAASVHSYRMWIEVERGDLAAARAAVDMTAALAEEHGFDIWGLVATLEGETVDALRDLEAGADVATILAHDRVLDGFIATWQMLQIAVFVPFYLGVSARLRAAAGDRDGAVARIDEALAASASTGMRFYDAELHRLRAGWTRLAGDSTLVDLTGGRPAVDVTGRSLQTALELARDQGALLFERRIDDDLAAADLR
jgi:class 3 adenylate cyclase